MDFAWIVNNRLRPWLRGWTESDGYRFGRPRGREAQKWAHYDHNEDFLNDLILRDGNTFLDIGANVGAWAVRAAPFYRKVIAVEPIFYKYLEKTLRLNRIRNVTVLPYALGSNHVKPGITYGGGEKMVKAAALDDLKLHPSVVKIDAEGAAYSIMVEGFFTFQASKPVIIIEVHTKAEREVDNIIPNYTWEIREREMPLTDNIYRENGKQVFLIGKPR